MKSQKNFHLRISKVETLNFLNFEDFFFSLSLKINQYSVLIQNQESYVFCVFYLKDKRKIFFDKDFYEGCFESCGISSSHSY